MEAPKGKTFGFIGLGAMGTPMVENLATKLPTETQIYVFDVIEKAVDHLRSQHPTKILKTQSAKEVTYSSVSICNHGSSSVSLDPPKKKKTNFRSRGA